MMGVWTMPAGRPRARCWAVGRSPDVPLAEGRGALLGRLEVPKIAGASVELGSEGLRTGHRAEVTNRLSRGAQSQQDGPSGEHENPDCCDHQPVAGKPLESPAEDLVFSSPLGSF